MPHPIVTKLRSEAPQLNRLSYFTSALKSASLPPPPVASGRPTCFFTGAQLKDHEVDIIYLDVSGVPREKVDKRTGLQGGELNRCGGKPADPDARGAVPSIVWCHTKLADFMVLVMEGRFYKQTSKFGKSPYLIYEQAANRLKKVLKKAQRLQSEEVSAAPSQGIPPQKKKAPAQRAEVAHSATPPLGTPSTSPSMFAHPVTDAEFTRWVTALPFNHWDERDLITHFLGTPTNGFVPKSKFVAMIDSLFTEAEKSAPRLFAAINSRFPNKDWGHQGIETGWVDFREV